jgi:peptidyl-prolyl cis-trans isomerase C
MKDIPMKHHFPVIYTLIALACACGAPIARAAGTKTETPLPPTVEAVVNNVPIPRVDVDEMVKASGQPDSAALREHIKSDLIVQQLVEQAADKANYGSRPEAVKAAMRARTVAASALFLRDQARPQPVTDAQVKTRYDQIIANAGQFEYRAQVVAVADAATAAAAMAELKKGVPFEAMAKQYNTAPNAGVAQWAELRTPIVEGKTGGMDVPLAQAITSMKPGTVTGPFAVGKAYAIVKLDEKRPTVAPSFDAAKPVLRQQLEAQAQQRAMAALVEKLAAQATIQQ